MQMVHGNYADTEHRSRPVTLTIFVLLAIGCLLFWDDARLPVLACCAAYVFIRFPETALGLYLFAGTFKSNPQIASAVPVDLTVALAAFVAIASAIRVARAGNFPSLPRAFFFYLPFVVMMLVSLSYTPDLTAGLDKSARFIGLTGIAILSPFVLLRSAKEVQRFFITLILSGLAVGLTSFSLLGSHDRLVAPGGDTISLGFITGIALVILWSFVAPRLSAPRRLLLYPISAVLGIALIGSGARGATIATATCMMLALFFSRKLFLDVLVLCVVGLLCLSFVPVPQASYDYLATLVREGPVKALSFRNDLMSMGVRLTLDHPLGGVGIGGFPFVSPNTRLYDYPHNVFLEISSEMGSIALLAFICLWGAAFRRTFRQLRTADFHNKAFSRVALALLIFGTIDMVKSGDINNIRVMWAFMSLPYVIANLEIESTETQLAPGRIVTTSPDLRPVGPRSLNF